MFCRSLARGGLDRSSILTDISSAEAFASELSEAVDSFLRFLGATFLAAEEFAQSGIGYSRLNWRRSRLLYSFPLTMSSDSAVLSFRILELDVRETTMRSSSLSNHAAVLPSSEGDESWSEVVWGRKSGIFATEGVESRKNS